MQTRNSFAVSYLASQWSAVWGSPRGARSPPKCSRALFKKPRACRASDLHVCATPTNPGNASSWTTKKLPQQLAAHGVLPGDADSLKRAWAAYLADTNP